MGSTESTVGVPSENVSPQKPAEGLETCVTVDQVEVEKKEHQQSSSTEKTIESQEFTDVIKRDKEVAEHSKQNDSRHVKSNTTDASKKLDSKNRPLKTAIRVAKQVVSIRTFLLSSFSKKDSKYVMVEIPKRPEDHAADLGFILQGGNNSPCIPGDPGIFVKHVIAGSSVDGKLRPGDRILTINGLAVTNVPVKYARQAVKKAKCVLTLYIKSAPKRQQRINEAIKRENERDIPVFSNEEIEGFEDAFSVFDVNGNGKIKVSDVFPLIRSLGYNPLEAAVWCYMNELELTANRKIKFVEFLRVMASLIMDEERQENGLDPFRVFDTEQRGYISSEELTRALKCMPGSAQMTEYELAEILQIADPDGDGKIDIQDFQSLVDRQ